MEQAALEGFETRQATDRLFFAVFPEPAAGERIAQLARDMRATHALRGNPLLTGRLHVTLFALGDYAGLPVHIVERATEAAARVHTEPFEVSLDTVGSFIGRRDHPLVLRGLNVDSPLHMFRRRLGEQLLATAAIRDIPGAFEPHVTLLYDSRAVTPEPVEPISWTVRELVLVHSLLGQTRHLVVDRWPLR